MDDFLVMLLGEVCLAHMAALQSETGFLLHSSCFQWKVFAKISYISASLQQTHEPLGISVQHHDHNEVLAWQERGGC